MNWLDLLLFVVLAIGLIRGFLNGFIYEIAHLGAFFLGLYAGFQLADRLAPHVASSLGAGPTIVHYVSFFIVFAAIWIGVILLSKFMEGLITVAFMGIFNKIGGGLFGLLKYGIMLSVFIYFFHKADSKLKLITADTKANAVCYYPLLKTAPAVLPVLNNLDKKIRDEIKSH